MADVRDTLRKIMGRDVDSFSPTNNHQLPRFGGPELHDYNAKTLKNACLLLECADSAVHTGQ